MQQAQDFLEECTAIAALLSSAQPQDFAQATQFKGWSINTILQHLYYFDRLALKSATDAEAFDRDWAEFMKVCRNDDDLARATNVILDGLEGEALFDAWKTGFQTLAKVFANTDPKARVKWVGPSMSARSSITARLMETWSHSQAIFDALGVTRKNEDRIKNIAVLGVNTFGWTHKNRGEAIPEKMPHLRLTAPSGEIWQWGELSEVECIEGPAEDFCMVVAQTRNIADTRLRVSGKDARHWMNVAQCFAGPPRTPPAPGTRFKQAG